MSIQSLLSRLVSSRIGAAMLFAAAPLGAASVAIHSPTATAAASPAIAFGDTNVMQAGGPEDDEPSGWFGPEDEGTTPTPPSDEGSGWFGPVGGSVCADGYVCCNTADTWPSTGTNSCKPRSECQDPNQAIVPDIACK